MNKEADKHIERLVDKMMKEVVLESPSKDFTNLIMTEVEQMDQVKFIAYKPLISKKLWLFILSSIMGMVIYILINNNLTTPKWFDFFEFESISKLMPNINFSSTILYASIILSVLFATQIIVLKNYFNKRLAL